MARRRGRPEKPLPPPTNAKERFGAQLRELRHINGLGLAAMAALSDCSVTTIGQAERGVQIPGEALVHTWDTVLNANNILNAYYEDMRHEERHRRLTSPQRRGPSPARPTRPVPGDRSEWVADVTVPDGTLMRPSQTFTKTWRLRNAGKVRWTDRYLMRLGTLVAAGQVATPRLTPIPDTAPGEEVDISVPCKAHVVPGTSVAHFKFADADGHLYFPDTDYAGILLSITVLDDGRSH